MTPSEVTTISDVEIGVHKYVGGSGHRPGLWIVIEATFRGHTTSTARFFRNKGVWRSYFTSRFQFRILLASTQALTRTSPTPTPPHCGALA